MAFGLPELVHHGVFALMADDRWPQSRAVESQQEQDRKGSATHDAIILSLREGRKVLPLSEHRAWERALPPVVTAEDLRVAWRRMIADLNDQDAMDDFGLIFHAFIKQ